MPSSANPITAYLQDQPPAKQDGWRRRIFTFHRCTCMICADVRIHWYGTHTTRSADTLDPNVGSKHPTALTPSRLHRNRSFSSYAEGHADVDLLGCCPTPSVSRRIGSYSTSRELTSPIFAQPHCSSAIIRAVRRGASKDVRTML